MFPAVHEIDGLPLTVSVACCCIHGVLRFRDLGFNALPSYQIPGIMLIRTSVLVCSGCPWQLNSFSDIA